MEGEELSVAVESSSVSLDDASPGPSNSDMGGNQGSSASVSDNVSAMVSTMQNAIVQWLAQMMKGPEEDKKEKDDDDDDDDEDEDEDEKKKKHEITMTEAFNGLRDRWQQMDAQEQSQCMQNGIESAKQSLESTMLGRAFIATGLFDKACDMVKDLTGVSNDNNLSSQFDAPRPSPGAFSPKEEAVERPITTLTEAFQSAKDQWQQMDLAAQTEVISHIKSAIETTWIGKAIVASGLFDKASDLALSMGNTPKDDNTSQQVIEPTVAPVLDASEDLKVDEIKAASIEQSEEIVVDAVKASELGAVEEVVVDEEIAEEVEVENDELAEEETEEEVEEENEESALEESDDLGDDLVSGLEDAGEVVAEVSIGDDLGLSGDMNMDMGLGDGGLSGDMDMGLGDMGLSGAGDMLSMAGGMGGGMDEEEPDNETEESLTGKAIDGLEEGLKGLTSMVEMAAGVPGMSDLADMGGKVVDMLEKGLSDFKDMLGGGMEMPGMSEMGAQLGGMIEKGLESLSDMMSMASGVPGMSEIGDMAGDMFKKGLDAAKDLMSKGMEMGMSPGVKDAMNKNGGPEKMMEDAMKMAGEALEAAAKGIEMVAKLGMM